jgi:hypothetical protein
MLNLASSPFRLASTAAESDFEAQQHRATPAQVVMWETFPHQKPTALLGLAQKEGFCKGTATVADAKGVDVAVSEAAAQLRMAFGREMMGSIWGPATLKSSATLLLLASDASWMHCCVPWMDIPGGLSETVLCSRLQMQNHWGCKLQVSWRMAMWDNS